MTVDPRHPNFIIIGAQKAGTTTLFQHICNHPEVFPSKIKETHFFTNVELQAAGASEYYNRYFKGSENFKCKGEATPAYLRNGTEVIPRIDRLLDKNRIKFIVILRDPVERAWSHFLHRKRSLNEPLEFPQALEIEQTRLASGDENAGYFSQGLYGKQLAPWIENVGLNSILMVRFEDMLSDPTNELARVFRYLELSSISSSSAKGVKKNQGGDPRFPIVMKYLKNPNAPGKKFIKSLVAPEIRREMKTRIRQMNVRPFRNGDKPSLDKVLKNELWLKYQDDLELLQESTGFSIDVWAKEYPSCSALSK